MGMPINHIKAMIPVVKVRSVKYKKSILFTISVATQQNTII